MNEDRKITYAVIRACVVVAITLFALVAYVGIYALIVAPFLRVDVALAVFSAMFAAICIWLIVRIINRREKWARWTAVAIVVLAMYPLSFGPACWWLSNVSELPHGTLPAFRRVPHFYRPIGWMAAHGPASLRVLISRYAILGLRNECMECETEFGGQFKIMWFCK